jgi:hypothetical protein
MQIGIKSKLWHTCRLYKQTYQQLCQQLCGFLFMIEVLRHISFTSGNILDREHIMDYSFVFIKT